MRRFTALLATAYQKLGFKRLFWRIFICFWLSSLLVMIATGFVIISKYSSEEYTKRYRNDVLTQAERIVWRYEQSLAVQANRPVKLK
ncbi:MAG: sensor histidine kinase, partial [Paraglaciecola chathamensis]